MDSTLREETVIVRYDPDLRSPLNGEPAEAAVRTENHDGEPRTVVTFGPLAPGHDMRMLALLLRATVAPKDDDQ